MSTKFTPSTPLFRPQGHATTAAAHFAEGVNQIVLDAEVFLDPADLGAYIQFWVSDKETGNDWKGPYRAAPSGAAMPVTSLLPLASAGPNGCPVYTTGIIPLSGYVGVVRWRAQIVIGDQDVTEVPRIYDVRLRRAQSVADNENPPRYYWMRNDVSDETNSLSVDDLRSVNFDAAESARQRKLVVSAVADPATVQSDVRQVVNPSDLLRLDANYLDAASCNAKTTQESLASFDKAPAGSAPVTTSGLGDAVLSGSTITCQGANGALWMRKMTSGAWQGLGEDFDVTLAFDSAFGAAPEAIGYGSQKTGVFLYSADAENPWNGTVNNYIKLYVADDGFCYLETQINNEGFKRTSVARMGDNVYTSAKGSLRLLRNGGVVSAFLRNEASGNPNVNAGAVLVGQFELSENLHLSYFVDGATNGGVTTHQLSLTDSVQGNVPAGVRFFVSNDDGYAWKPATPGIPVFMGETGQNLRWRADIDADQGSLDLRNLALSAWAYRQASFGTVDAVTQAMKDQALANGGGSFTNYLYWQTIDKDQTLILMEDALRESTPTEALLAKIEVTLDAAAQVLRQRVTNYKNKVYLSDQGTLLHENHVLESDVAADGFFVETRLKVTGLVNQQKSGRFELSIEQPLDENDLPIDGKVSIFWNNTPYWDPTEDDLNFPWSAVAGQTITLEDPEAGTITFQVGPDMPSALPRVDVVRVVDSRPGTDGIQEQVCLNWSRRPTVVTVFDGHPESVPVQSSIGHEGFTANKLGGFVLPDGKKMAGFWRAETQW